MAHEWEWNLKTGDQFAVTIQHETASDTVVGEFQAKQTNRYKLATSWIVKSVDDQRVATIEKTIDSIQFFVDSVSPIPMSVALDTASGTASGKTFTGTEGTTYLKHMQTLVGKTLEMEMKPNGETKTLPNPAATQAAIDAFPKSDYVLQMFHVNAVAESETAYFPTLPTKILAPSESWQRESDQDVNENEAFVTTFKYVGKTESDDKVVDEFSTTVLPKKAADRELPPGKPDPVTVSKQTGAGASFFDRTNGNFASATYRSEIVTTSDAQNTTITSDFSVTFKRK
ncbi:MAG: hypothetical protein WBD31_17940 [Rubripirellula sp.]